MKRTEDLRADGDSDEKEREVVTRAESIAGGSFDAVEEEDELDPVALKKAFKFATYSSVGLVWHLRSLNVSGWATHRFLGSLSPLSSSSLFLSSSPITSTPPLA